MAHMLQQNFCVYVRTRFPGWFHGPSILKGEEVHGDPMEVVDFGSLDINGNNRFLFFNYNYTGVDIGEGRNVDVISTAHEFSSDILYDFVISTEALEHDMHWEKSLVNMEKLLRPGRMLLITCASTGRPEHGTLRTEGSEAFSSPLTSRVEEWMNYYRNLTEEDIRSVWDIDKIFAAYSFTYQPPVQGFGGGDLYFVGIKQDKGQGLVDHALDLSYISEYNK